MPSLDQAALDYGQVSLSDERVVVVHMLLYGLDMQAPSMQDARAWAEHYKLAERPNHIVLVGDERMLSSATMRMIPGLQLVDPDFRLRIDAAGRGAPHDLWTELWPRLGAVMDEVSPAAPRAY